MKWIRLPGWCFFPGIHGITILPGIVISREYEWEAGCAHWGHEYCHILQQKRIGKLKFYFVILGQYIRHGYRNAPLEIEAREFARQYGNYAEAWNNMRRRYKDKWA